MLYLAHYGLREPPFSITPDTAFVYPATAHQEAINTLMLALEDGEGFIKITGEVGTGKTLLCRRLLAHLAEYPERYVSAYLPNPNLDPLTLTRAFLEELGEPVDDASDPYHLHKQLNATLLRHAQGDRMVVLCIDEAQALPLEGLEALRLISNLETEKRKLLQMVLFGQPELDVKLGSAEVRQLRQRITFHYRMRGLTDSELAHYLAHRLKVAGHQGRPLFSPASIRLIRRATRGTPRLVNIVAHKALMAAYGEGGYEVGRRHVRAAARDSDGARLPWWVI
jgi:MSHA biogenesis protein MshM